MQNHMELMKLMGIWNSFKANHPKFPKFITAAAQPGVITANTILEMKITTADGRILETNMKITESDMELFQQIKNIQP